MNDFLPIDQKSHLRGPQSTKIWDKTIPELFGEIATQYSERTALIFPGIANWNYSRLSKEVNKLAWGLLGLGISKGDRVGIWSPNNPEWVLLQLATARIGAILVTINPAYRVMELNHALVKAGIKVLFFASSFKGSNYFEMIQSILPEIKRETKGNIKIQSKSIPSLKSLVKIGGNPIDWVLEFNEVLNSGEFDFEELNRISKGLKSDEAINIQFTSGTTGLPKGATLTHKNIINNARFVMDTIRFESHDKLCLPVPLYHCFGMVMGVLGCITKGACIVLPSESFCPDATLKAISEFRCTGLYSVPTMFLAMLEKLDEKPLDLQSLRTGIMAGAPCPIKVMRRVIKDMNMEQVTIAYGMTETSPVSFQSHVNDPVEKRVTTVGRIHPHAEVKIIDKKGGIVPINQQGELCTRGYLVMKEYWDDQSATQKSIDKDGWMHTGDLGKVDEEGYCTITGRVSDMIIRGGENIYPKEIEDFLFQHPSIKDVQVFGISDERLGEQVCAWIIPKNDVELTEQELIEFCKDNLAHYKIPKFFRFKTEFPITVTGKPQKFKMRQVMHSEFGLPNQT